MKTVGHKRTRDDLNHKYMWHLRLSHIGEDRLNKLEKHGILDLLNFESYPIYKSSLIEKMTKLPFMGYGEGPLNYLLWYTLIYVGHLMYRSGVIISTSLPLPMIIHDTDMYFF